MQVLRIPLVMACAKQKPEFVALIHTVCSLGFFSVGQTVWMDTICGVSLSLRRPYLVSLVRAWRPGLMAFKSQL